MPPSIKPRRRLRTPRRNDRFGLIVIAVSTVVFAATLWIITPNAPGRTQAESLLRQSTADQHYASCADARRDGRRNIPRWDPSYRPHMDRDRDGLACEPYPF